MKLIFALGNPDATYEKTRHNVGFLVIDTYAAKEGTAFLKKDKFKAFIAEVSVGHEKVLLAKPSTYYNHVGESLNLLVDFYKVEPEDILIIHDELSLPFGTLRTRIGGSDAGNNGIKSVNTHGGKHSARLRVGVANDQRNLIGDTEFVLSKFSKDETSLLIKTVVPGALQQIEAFLKEEFAAHSVKLLATPTPDPEISDQD